MTLDWTDSLERVDWAELSALYLAAGMGLKEPPALKTAFTNSRFRAFEPDRRLLLSAEMKLPGRAWLEFVVEPRPGGATIRQTAIFDPIGLAGLAYWYLVFPLHCLVFAGMLEGIARKASANMLEKNEP